VPLFKVVRPEGLNVYDILKREKLVITQASLEKITRNLSA
jgi:ribosomal protein L4